MRTRVKYCGLVRSQDVDAAVAIGVDAVGFVFYPQSPRLLDADTAAVLRRRLPSWVMSVGLFVNATTAEINQVSRQVGLDVIQLHGDETVAQAQLLEVPWWKALRIAAGGGESIAGALERYHAAEFCLLDSLSPGYGGSGKTFDWALVPPDAGSRIIMSGGLNAANVGEVIDTVGPFAVDTSSAIQGENPREKDVGRMESFMQAVCRADGR